MKPSATIVPEYLSFRCCMCPNIESSSTTCPGIQGTPHPEETPCRFVKSYIDNRGRIYKVLPGTQTSGFNIRYQKQKNDLSSGWFALSAASCRETFDMAQADLNKLAEQKRWLEHTSTRD